MSRPQGGEEVEGEGERKKRREKKEREEQRETMGEGRGRQKRGESTYRSKSRKELRWEKTPHFMKMRFSTTYDYNYHQRVQAVECACNVCANVCMLETVHILMLPTRLHMHLHAYQWMCLNCPLGLRFLWAHPLTLPTSLHAFMCVWLLTRYVCVCAQSLNLPHLCLLQYIYMKRQLTFLSCLKLCCCDILLTVAGDILPHFPQ